MTEEVPVKRKRGRPRKVVVDEPPKRSPAPEVNPQRGKHTLHPGDIAGYNTADMNYQFKVIRRVETSDRPAWVWGSTQGTTDIDMIVEETECTLLKRCV